MVIIVILGTVSSDLLNGKTVYCGTLRSNGIWFPKTFTATILLNQSLQQTKGNINNITLHNTGRKNTHFVFFYIFRPGKLNL